MKEEEDSLERMVDGRYDVSELFSTSNTLTNPEAKKPVKNEL